MDPTLPVDELPTAPSTLANGEPGAPTTIITTAPLTDGPHQPSAFDNVEPEEDTSVMQQLQPELGAAVMATTLGGPSSVDPTAPPHPHTVPQRPAEGGGVVAASASAPAATSAVGDNDDDDDGEYAMLIGSGGRGAGASQSPEPRRDVPAAAPDAEHRALPSMKDLFGPFFQVNDVPEKVADPALVDTRSMLHTHFGSFVQEADVLLQFEADALAQEMRANMEAREQARVQQLFGEAGPLVLLQEAQEEFTILRSTVPASPTELLTKDAVETEGEDPQHHPRPLLPVTETARHTWLVEMPKMLPNRQTLHADPQPFFPARCEVLESDDRALYTPQNVLRWAYHKPTGLYMSNTRVVRWSDGSYTLHVGSDTYSLDSSKSNSAIHILGSETSISKGNVTLSSIAKTLNPGKHFVVESTEARSIERAVLMESTQLQTKAQRMKLAYAQAPLPEVDWTKPNAARNPQEEYVAMEYERRTKELQRRFKEGRPMTLREQLEEDALLFQQLSTANVEELLERQREERRQAALQVARRAAFTADGQRAGGRSRLDRDMGLAVLDGGVADPFTQFDQEDKDSEVDEDSSGEDIEAMMDRKRQRQESDDRDAAYAPLVAALERVLRTIPRSMEDAYGEVEGVITYMKGHSFSPSLLQSEIPSLAKSIAERVPGADLSEVLASFHALPK